MGVAVFSEHGTSPKELMAAADDALYEESSAAAEQTAKACTNLSGLAFDMQKIVSQFRLPPGDDQKAPNPASEPALGAEGDGTPIRKTNAAAAGSGQ